MRPAPARARRRRWAAVAWLVCLCLWGAAGCSDTHSPQASRETNWLRTCEGDPDCGPLMCICNVCTLECTGSTECGGGRVCLSETSALVSGACGGAMPVPAPGLCSPECSTADDCAQGQRCTEGACIPGALIGAPGDASTGDAAAGDAGMGDAATGDAGMTPDAGVADAGSGN